MILVKTSIEGPFLTAWDTKKFQKWINGKFPKVENKSEREKQKVAKQKEDAKTMRFVWANTESNKTRMFLKVQTSNGEAYSDLMTGQIYGKNGVCWSLDTMRISGFKRAAKSSAIKYIKQRHSEDDSDV
jgi:hypothetical protein